MQTVFDRPVDPGLIQRSLADARSGSMWLDLPRPSHPALTEPTHCDLLVVGGGYTGLWTALHAAERNPGARIVLVEADRIGWAASGRNGGFVDASITHGYDNGNSRWPDEIDTLETLGLENLDGMQADIERLGLDVDWERTGMLSVATEAHQVPWLRDAAGEGQGQFLDADAVRAQVASPTYLAGLFSARTCAIVHPAKLALELARACTQAGVAIHEHTPVQALSARPGGLLASTPGGVVSAERRPGQRARQGQLGDQGLGDAGGVHDVGEQPVAAGGGGGELDGEEPGGALARVQVEDLLELGLVQHEKVHQVVVIGEQIVEPLLLPAGARELQGERAAVHPGVHLQRPVDALLDAARLRVPPPRASPQAQPDEHRRHELRPPLLPDDRRGERRPRRQLRLPAARPDDADQARDEDEQADEQRAPKRRLHPRGPLRQGRHRHRELTAAALALDEDAHLPRARGHHPQVPAERLRILLVAGRHIGSRGEHRAVPAQRQRDHAQPLDVGIGGADLQVGDPGDDLGRTHGDIQRVGSRLALVKYVRAADMGAGRARRREQRQAKDHQLDERACAHGYLCTPRRKRAAARPSRTLSSAASAASPSWRRKPRAPSRSTN